MSDDLALANDVAAWLRRAQGATARRDAALARVSQLVASGDQSAADLEDCVSSVLHQQLPAVAPSVAAVAEAVSASARVAEGSYRRVKAIDRSLTRVNEALDVTRSVLKMRGSLGAMTEALNRGDIDAASAAVAEYDETSRKLKGREKLLMMGSSSSSSNTAGAGVASPERQNSAGSDSVVNASGTSDTDSTSGRDTSLDSHGFVMVPDPNRDQGAFVQDTRARVHEAAMAQLEKATAAMDEPAIRSCVTVLSRLSFLDDAERTFADFLARKNKRELKAMVDAGLEAARTLRGASHLELVRHLLDHTVACLEAQEAFVRQHLGGRVRSILLALHDQSAALCVEVLDDFLSQRKLRSVGIGGASRDGSNNSSGALCDPVVVDQQLEDLANLMVCCSTYFNFLANRIVQDQSSWAALEAAAAPAAAGGAPASEQNGGNAPENRQRRYLAQNLVRKNNLLFERVQDLLAIFVPLQIDYFDAACQVAIKDSMDALAGFEREFLQKLGGASSSSSSTGKGADISGFFASVASALGGENAKQQQQSSSSSGASAASANDAALSVGQIHIPGIDAIDDIFYACRWSVNRVMGTRTAQIASPTLMVINNNVLRDKLLPLAQQRASVHASVAAGGANASPSRSLTPKTLLGMITALIWAGAVASLSSNCKHLAEEIGILAEKFFDDSHDDAMRFAAQRLDFVQTATDSDNALDSACKNIGAEVFRLCGGASVELRQAGFVDSGAGAAKENGKKGDPAGASAAANNGNNNGGAANAAAAAAEEALPAMDWVAGATGRFSAVLSTVALPSAPWPESVRCAVVSSFLDCAVQELEETLRRKRFDVSGALRLDKDLRQLRNYFAGMDLDIPVRDRFKRLSAVSTVLLAERRADAAAQSVLSQQEIGALLKQRVDAPVS